MDVWSPRALSVHREAQLLPPATPVSQIYTMGIPKRTHSPEKTPHIFSLLGGVLAFGGGPGGRATPLNPSPWRPWTRLRRARPGIDLNEKREDDLLEVGIEGVALNPNRK